MRSIGTIILNCHILRSSQARIGKYIWIFIRIVLAFHFWTFYWLKSNYYLTRWEPRRESLWNFRCAETLLDKRRSWEVWISIKIIMKTVFTCYFHQLFEITSKLLYLAIICYVTWPYLGHWWVEAIFLIGLYFVAFWRSFAGKIIVPVHLNISNDTSSSYLNFPPLQNPWNHSLNWQKCFPWCCVNNCLYGICHFEEENPLWEILH